ncbi:MAG: rRNA maturation RNase YbeY [candidate division Zixibacteria bacterium]|nr:rRNA maturation RNase YbeY [candidate division Zixibacteria bacterium]
MNTTSEPKDPEPPSRRRTGSQPDIVILRGPIEGRVPRSVLHDVALRVCKGERLRGPVHLIVLGDRDMRQLNRRHMKKDRPTDVLTFPLTTPDTPRHFSEPIGEVYCNIDHARRWSAETGDSQTSELARLAVHGLLHLAGYDHHTERDRQTMTARENRYLKSAGLIDRRTQRETA